MKNFMGTILMVMLVSNTSLAIDCWSGDEEESSIAGLLYVNSALKINKDRFRISEVYKLGSDLIIEGVTSDYSKSFEMKLSLLEDLNGGLEITNLETDEMEKLDVQCESNTREMLPYNGLQLAVFQPRYLVH